MTGLIISGPGGLAKGGGRTDENNTLVLANPGNSYTGNTSLTKGSILLAASEVIPHGPGAGTVSMAVGTTLNLGGYSETINNLSGAGTVTSTASVSSPVFFTNDAGTDISPSKTYTHLLDFNPGASLASVNSVNFDNAGSWSLTGATAGTANGATGATGGISTLLEDFNYGGNPGILTLNGLTPGTTYEARLYQRRWGGDRTNLMTVTSGSQSATSVYNQDASATPSYLAFRYTADASGTAIIQTNTRNTANGSYHWYGATNEVVSAPVLTVGDASDSTFSGTITSNLGLTKQGSGSLTLTGANTYTGPTLVSGGSLLVNGSLNGTSAVTVGPGATLGGSGSITTAGFTVLAGGTLAPGNSPQTITINAPLVLSPGALFGVDLAIGGSAAAGNGSTGTDRVNLNGTLSLDGALLAGTWGGTLANTYLGTVTNDNRLWILNNDGSDTITGTFANSTPSPGLAALFGGGSPYFTNVGGQPFALFYSADFDTTSLSGGNDLLLIAIPEPDRVALILFGLPFLLLRRRR